MNGGRRKFATILSFREKQSFTMRPEGSIGRVYDLKVQGHEMSDARTVRVVLRSTAPSPFCGVHASYPTK
ncbi:hypothetical protein EDF24_2663 [Curtobacterium sp. PhB130]|nr:hypothetical protein EDF24_2663 [Curtobacterium sp. PhB130]